MGLFHNLPDASYVSAGESIRWEWPRSGGHAKEKWKLDWNCSGLRTALCSVLCAASSMECIGGCCWTFVTFVTPSRCGQQLVISVHRMDARVKSLPVVTA